MFTKRMIGAVLLLALAALWARATGWLVSLPAYGGLPLGVLLLSLGGCLLVFVFKEHATHGPDLLLTRGVYRVLPHPFHVGLVLLSFGFSAATRSASGLWLVSPLVALGAAAHIYGVKLPQLRGRFGADAVEALNWLPADTSDAPTLLERGRCYLFAMLPWVFVYEAIAAAGIPDHFWNTALSLDGRLPVLPWMEVFYGSTYLVVGLAPLLARTRRDLRRLTLRATLASALIFPFYLTVPTLAPRRPFEISSAVAQVLAWEQRMDPPIEALPSFHMIWSILVASAIGRGRRLPARCLLWSWVTMIAASCVLTGAHTVVDVVVGGLLGALLLHVERWRDWMTEICASVGLVAFTVLAATLLRPEEKPVLLLTAWAVSAGWLLLVARDLSHRAVVFTSAWSLLILLLINRLWIASVPEPLLGGVFLILTGAGLFLVQALNSNSSSPYWRGWPSYQWTAASLAATGVAVTVANPGHAALGTILFASLCMAPIARVANSQTATAVHASRDLQQL